MHLKAKRPVFVPQVYWPEIEKLSKAALMDMVWDLAQRGTGATDEQPRKIMDEVQKTADIVITYRKREAVDGIPPEWKTERVP